MVERIRTLLESRQLTPTQFADLIGVARPIISHVLSGRNKPSLDVVQRILAALPDLSMAWLLNGTEPMLTTAREAALVMPAPRPAEPSTSPLPVAPLQLVTPAQTSPPGVPVQHEQITGSQDNNGNVVAPGTTWATVPTPVATGPLVAAAPISASPVPGARPVNPATSRPPMPRRFPVKPSLAEQPAPAAAPQAPVAPLPSIPVSIPLLTVGLASSSVGPVEGTEMVASGNEDTVKEAITYKHAVPGELLRAVEDPLAGVVPVLLAGAEAVAPAFTPLEVAMPAAGMSASVPAPMPAAGAVLNAAPTLASDMATALFTGAEKPIRRIVIFYRDGSFADYQPE